MTTVSVSLPKMNPINLNALVSGILPVRVASAKSGRFGLSQSIPYLPEETAVSL